MRTLFRSRYQPERLLRDVMFGLAVVIVALGITFSLDVAIGAIKNKETCPRIDAKHNIGIDQNGKLCRRKS